MMLAPKVLQESELEYGGFIMSTSLQIGILIGSLIGSQLDKI